SESVHSEVRFAQAAESQNRVSRLLSRPAGHGEERKLKRMLMTKGILGLATLLMLPVCIVSAQVTNDPFPKPIPTTEGVIRVRFAEFATIPDFNGAAPRI